MKIQDINAIKVLHEGEEYIRFGGGVWYMLYEGSYEPVTEGSDELEELFLVLEDEIFLELENGE